jgi:curved DNA-binding protein
MRGEDTHARVLIDVEDAFHGAVRSLSLKHSELGADGRPQLRERTLKVRIPKGVRQGQQIRLAGQGGAGLGRGGAGDLFLEVDFRPHPLYRVEGRDLYMDLPLAPWEAALGAPVKVPTPLGSVELKIPPGSRSGSRLRLKGRGIPAAQPGDLFAVLQIVTPPAADAQARAAYQQFAGAFDFNPRAGMEGSAR